MDVETSAIRLDIVDGPVDDVTAVVHRPTRHLAPAVLLTHGAGGTLESAGLVAMAQTLAAAGHTVVRANLPHVEAGRRTPPRAERATGWIRSMLASARAQTGCRRWVVAGKSYGGRVASLAAAEPAGLDVAGLVFYGYPLHAPGRTDRLRADHWPDLHAPTLFLQGTNDPFCDLDLLRANVDRLPRRHTLEVVEGGDHGLRVTRRLAPDGVASSEVATIERLAPTVVAWLRDLP